MNIFEAIILGLIQGLTEFIPVSSSGHLLLLHNLLGIEQHGLGFDVALHIGTLLALLSFFYNDVRQLILALFGRGPKRRLIKVLVLATIPAVIAGLFLQSAAETTFRSPYLVVITLAMVGLIMLAAEQYAGKRQSGGKVEAVTPKQGLLVGLAQAVALVPGVSRSGSTITAGLFAGLDRLTATRFSFLLSIPITFGAILKFAFDGDTVSQVRDDAGLFVIGIITAFISGVVAIRFLLRYIAKHSLNLFAYYRISFSLIVLALLIIF